MKNLINLQKTLMNLELWLKLEDYNLGWFRGHFTLAQHQYTGQKFRVIKTDVRKFKIKDGFMNLSKHKNYNSHKI